MPNLTEKEMMVALAQARLLGCTKYTTVVNGSIYFFDDKKHLRLRASPHQSLWIGDTAYPSDGFWQRGDIAALRKRYERSTRISKGET